MKRIIKLINNERTNAKLLSKKACTANINDYCVITNHDRYHCDQYSTDICNKDQAACTNGAIDNCLSFFFDTTKCDGKGAEDYKSDY